ncbi:Protein CsaA [uncultured Alphaproteobacteria bacterium]|jgi:tRNA-binding protein|uniref:Protein CsaA n=1 Tax=uncultured Alphaproteobacteria bacterium TaxID=91750 RepID=A0A212JWJ7_9PROT|nr:Protein CsaA [uncultured Alphaproteobacteria bacterium]
MTISYDEFAKVDVRVGRVVRAEPNGGARVPAYALAVDFGPEIGELASSAQLTAHYRPESLVGRLVLGVVNFPPKRIGGFKSECLILGVPDAEGNVVLLSPERNVPVGGKMF